jgi:hypothetical protein
MNSIRLWNWTLEIVSESRGIFDAMEFWFERRIISGRIKEKWF